MGYIEDIKKINSMAKELISHGIASSFDEAVVKATKMLGDEKSVTRNDDFDPFSRIEKPAQKQEASQATQPAAASSGTDERTGMTWQQAMAKNNEYMIKMLKDFQKQLGEYSTKIVLIETSLHELAKRHTKLSDMMVTKGSQEINIDVDDESKAEQAAPVQAQPKKEEYKQEQTVPQSRVGNYKPGDISIEKMFYYGNKK